MSEAHSFLLICSDRNVDLELLKTELTVSSRVGFTSGPRVLGFLCKLIKVLKDFHFICKVVF